MAPDQPDRVLLSGTSPRMIYYSLNNSTDDFTAIATDWTFESNYEPKPTPWNCAQSIRADVTRTYARLLNEAEKAYLRKINWEPTLQGIEFCFRWHDRTVQWFKSLPLFKTRFDRRIPCWRSGRWKSLT